MTKNHSKNKKSHHINSRTINRVLNYAIKAKNPKGTMLEKHESVRISNTHFTTKKKGQQRKAKNTNFYIVRLTQRQYHEVGRNLKEDIIRNMNP